MDDEGLLTIERALVRMETQPLDYGTASFTWREIERAITEYEQKIAYLRRRFEQLPEPTSEITVYQPQQSHK